MAIAVINDHSIHYETAGVADFRLRTPALLLHGNGENMHVFDRFVPLLSSSRGFVLMDSRYQGESEPLDPNAEISLSYEAMADDALKLMEDVLGVTEYDVIGSSDGAIVALLMALRSIRVRRLILVGLNTDPSGLKPKTARAIKHELKLCERRRDGEGAALCRMMLTGPHITGADLASIICETTVVYGKKDECVRREQSEGAANAIPRGSFVEFKTAGHDVVRTHPSELAELVRSLL